MQSLTNNFTPNVCEIELFGRKLLLSERTARDVEVLRDLAKKPGSELSPMVSNSIVIADGLKMNWRRIGDELEMLLEQPVEWYQFSKRKKIKSLSKQLSKLKSLTNVSNISTLPVRVLEELSDKVLELEGIDVEALKKKVAEIMQTERNGLAVTLQEA